MDRLIPWIGLAVVGVPLFALFGLAGVCIPIVWVRRFKRWRRLRAREEQPIDSWMTAFEERIAPETIDRELAIRTLALVGEILGVAPGKLQATDVLDAAYFEASPLLQQFAIDDEWNVFREEAPAFIESERGTPLMDAELQAPLAWRTLGDVLIGVDRLVHEPEGRRRHRA